PRSSGLALLSPICVPALSGFSTFFFFFQAEDGIRDFHVTGVQTCALPIWPRGTERRRLAGLVDVPVPAPRDPMDAVLRNPHVAEGKRFCWKCGEPVGRSTPVGPGPTEIGRASCRERVET